jgi:hypothetical protein
MDNEKKLPPFIVAYEKDGFTFYFNTGNPILSGIAYNFSLTKVGESGINRLGVVGFWAIEGYLYDYKIQEGTSEEYPTLTYYLENRGNHDLPNLWREWMHSVTVEEAQIVFDAFLATRRNKFETLADTPLDEKKTRSSKKPKSTSTAQAKPE